MGKLITIDDVKREKLYRYLREDSNYYDSMQYIGDDRIEYLHSIMIEKYPEQYFTRKEIRKYYRGFYYGG